MLEERKMREEIAEKLLFTCMCSGVTGCNVRREDEEVYSSVVIWDLPVCIALFPGTGKAYRVVSEVMKSREKAR